MKIWKAWTMHPQDGYVQVWASSERNVRQLARNEWSTQASITVEPVEIPTNKAGLIDWLNENFGTDNG